MLVGIDDPRRGMVLPAQGFGQKALGRRCIALDREKEVDRRTAGVHGPVQVHPIAFCSQTERARMVLEKQQALALSGFALLRGAFATSILAPFHHGVTANAKRLRRK